MDTTFLQKWRWLLVPITAVYLVGVLWWLTHSEQERMQNDGSVGLVQTPRSPATTALEPAAPSTITWLKEDTVLAPAPMDSILLHPCILPCVKNIPVPPLTAEGLRFIEAAKNHCARGSGMLIVTGHTDGDGSVALNERLSLERAEAIRDQVIGMGFPAERVEAIGAGAGSPIADNLTSKGKALNRRVTLVLDTMTNSLTPTRP